MFSAPAWLVSQFYALTNNYALAIGLVALTVMIIVTPLTLKSTKGMLEMQRLQPEMKRLQNQYRGDRQKLNEEMMKLYQEHKVNPLASCLPLLIQMPVFFIMYRVLHGLSSRASDGTFVPKYIDKGSELYASLHGKTEMLSFGLDLSRSPAHFISESVGKGLVYAALVVLLGLLYFVQQKMVASRAAVSPTMSATQAKLMQYLPVVFAVFQIFFLTGLVIYYIIQAIFRIGQNYYITKKFYGHEDSIGRQAQAASARAREENKAAGGESGGGMFAQAKRDAQARRDAIAEQRSGRGSAGGTARGGGRPSAGSSRTNGRAANRPAGSRPASTGKAAGKPAALAPTKDAPTPAPGRGKQAKQAPAGATPAPAPPAASKNGTNGTAAAAPSGGTTDGAAGFSATTKRTPPKNRPTPSANRPQRPSAPGRPKPKQ